MTKLNRHIRIFISSTFRDMQEEREMLVKQVFPKIRTYARRRLVEVTDIDLRWGITEEQAKTGQTLKVCLEEIYRCMESPIFFIGLLGNRYGWVPDNLTEEIKRSLKEDARFSRLVEKHLEKGVSVTELEILFGVLENDNLNQRTFFYIRDEDFSRQVIDEIKRQDSQFDEQTEYQDKQKALIERVKASKEVKCRDYNSYDNFIEQVEKDLKDTIDELFPIEDVPTETERIRIQHESYAQMRKGTYIRDEELFKEIGDAVINGGYTLIIGESGIGKSALMANYVEDIRKVDKDAFIIEHYVGGAGEDSADYQGIMKRIILEINDKLGIDVEAERFDMVSREKKTKGLPTDFEELYKMLVNKVDDVSKSYRTYIIIDAFNQIVQEEGKDIYWLPSHLPKGVTVLITATEDEVIKEAIKKKAKHKIVKMKGLDEGKKRQLISAYLKRYGKRLTEDQLAVIVKQERTSNPLYLKALLDELRLFGVYERLKDKIKELLEAKEIEDLFEKIIARCEIDYDISEKGWVGEALKLIYASRNGLSESEIIEITKEEVGVDLSRVELSTLLSAIESHLVVKGGDIDFGHVYFRKAVEDRYFKNQEDEGIRRYREILARYYEKKLEVVRSGGEWDRGKIARELPYQYYKLGDSERLFTAYSSIEVLEELVKDRGNYKDLSEYFGYLRSRDIAHEERLVDRVFRQTEGKEEIYFDLFYYIGNFLNLNKWYIQSISKGEINLKKEIMKCFQKVLSTLEPLHKKEPEKWDNIFSDRLSWIAKQIEHYEEKVAINLYMKELIIREKLYKINSYNCARKYVICLLNICYLQRNKTSIDNLKIAQNILQTLQEIDTDFWVENYTFSLHILAEIYHKYKLFHESLNTYIKLVELTENLSKNDKEKWFDLYDSVTQSIFWIYYKDLKKTDTALTWLKKSSRVIEDIILTNSEYKWVEKYYWTMDFMAKKYISEKQYGEALIIYENTINKIESLYNKNPYIWVIKYNELAKHLISLHMSMKHLKESEEHLKKIIKQLETHDIRNYPDIYPEYKDLTYSQIINTLRINEFRFICFEYYAIFLSKLSVIYKCFNLMDEALTYQNKAIEIWKALRTKKNYRESNDYLKSFDYAQSLQNLSDIFFKLKNFYNASQSLKELVRLFKSEIKVSFKYEVKIRLFLLLCNILNYINRIFKF